MFRSFLKTIKDVFLGPPIMTQYEDMILQEEAKKITEVTPVTPQITDSVTQAPKPRKRTKKTKE